MMPRYSKSSDNNFVKSQAGAAAVSQKYVAPLIKKQIEVPVISKTSIYHSVSGKSLPELLYGVEFGQDPVSFKETVLGCVQLYFDGLVDDKRSISKSRWWAKQSAVLTALLEGAQATISAFYRKNQEIPFDKVREFIVPNSACLINYGSKKQCKDRHLHGLEQYLVGRVVDVVNLLGGDDVDLVIPVASGGFESALLIADYWGLKVEQLFPVRYSSYSRSDREVLTPVQAPEDFSSRKISGKKVLLVDDIVHSGDTAVKVAAWVAKHVPAREYFAVIKQPLANLNYLGFRSFKNSEHLYVVK